MIKGQGRSWKVMEGHGRSWKVKVGQGRPVGLYCQPQSNSLSYGLWILDIKLGFGTWIWDLGLGFGI